jgi:flagellar protein FlaG
MFDINGIGQTNVQLDAVAAESVAKRKAQVEASPAPKIAENPQIGTKDSEAEKPTSEKVERLTTELDALLSRMKTNLRLEVDTSTDSVVIKVVDPETQEVIKQIPSEDMLKVSQRVEEVLARYSKRADEKVTVFND